MRDAPEIVLATVPATLTLNKSNKSARQGTFKKAWFGTITCAAQSILAATSGEPVEICAKQSVYSLPTEPTCRITHTGVTQASMLVTEARCLVWARALLREVFAHLKSLIDHELGTPPFSIPWGLDFVEAGLSKDSKGSIYLVERKIEGRFVKYINNDSPRLIRPRPDAPDGDAIYEKAEFLSCTQHVQFILTQGMVFVTDYQGMLQRAIGGGILLIITIFWRVNRIRRISD